jgi:putative OPT family oligopeptide transporter
MRAASPAHETGAERSALRDTPAKQPPELTIRGIILGGAITVVFLAANVYLGLRTGMTFSSSIPAAVISMSALRALGSGGILENNIVQTQASAAGTLCNVILVLPGLILIGFWNSFPLWQTMTVCLLGGVLGVAYSVPLRRVMVVGSALPFPEGVAAAEVLRAGHKEEAGSREGGEGGLKELAVSAAAAAALNLLTNGFKVLPDKLAGSLSLGGALFQMGGSLSLALIGVGYLVRIGACLALLLGLFIAWGVAVPVLMAMAPTPRDLADAADAVWSDKVRLIGAGIIASGGLWTVITLVKPMIDSVRLALKASRRGRGAAAPREERDIPIAWVGGAVAILSALTAGLFAWFASGFHLTVSLVWFVPIVTLLTVLLSLLMASACGYMAALLGSSCSPISGIGILSTLLIAAGFAFALPAGDAADGRVTAALTLFMASIVVTVSSIANDNLQDLKTGNMVGAAPWKQQAALIIGVVAGAIAFAPLIELLYFNYGFTGALPRPGMPPENAMPAPQAALMTQIANGIIRHQLAWNMVGIGAVLGVVLVAIESWLRRRRGFSLPALTVGIGIYLPYEVSLTIAIGGVIGWFAERAVARAASRMPERMRAEAEAKARRRGVLIASGFLVGESMSGVLFAAADAWSGRGGSLALPGLAEPHISTALAALLFAFALAAFYRFAARPL